MPTISQLIRKPRTPKIYREMAFDDVLYSLATANCGALTLHNYPNSLRMIPEKPEQGIYTDLATVDIVRDRERGVPRYCEFRRLLAQLSAGAHEGSGQRRGQSAWIHGVVVGNVERQAQRRRRRTMRRNCCSA